MSLMLHTECARHEKALQDRAKAMADKWQQYREMQINIQENKEMTR
jgi:chemotaxis regulatin CheY-phosphate phosphatase CheZ